MAIEKVKPDIIWAEARVRAVLDAAPATAVSALARQAGWSRSRLNRAIARWRRAERVRPDRPPVRPGPDRFDRTIAEIATGPGALFTIAIGKNRANAWVAMTVTSPSHDPVEIAVALADLPILLRHLSAALDLGRKHKLIK